MLVISPNSAIVAAQRMAGTEQFQDRESFISFFSNYLLYFSLMSFLTFTTQEAKMSSVSSSNSKLLRASYYGEVTEEHVFAKEEPKISRDKVILI